MSLHTAKETASGLASVSFNDDTNTGLHSRAADTTSLRAGGIDAVEATATSVTLKSGSTTKMVIDADQGVAEFVKIDIPAVSGNPTIVSSLLNPFGTDVLITRALLRSTTIATAAATLDIGTAADAVTSNDTLFDGLDVNAATGIFDNLNDTHNGSNGGLNRLWTSTQYLNIAKATGNANGLVAALYVSVVRL